MKTKNKVKISAGLFMLSAGSHIYLMDKLDYVYSLILFAISIVSMIAVYEMKIKMMKEAIQKQD